MKKLIGIIFGALLGLVAITLSLKGQTAEQIKISILEFSCSKNIASACHEIGIRLEDDGENGSKLYTKACDLGHAESCLFMAIGYMGGYGGSHEDVTKAMELYNKACDIGDGSQCWYLAIEYEVGSDGKLKKDENMAEKLYTKSCKLEHAASCSSLGFMYEMGTVHTIDANFKAVELYTKSCKLDGSTCDNLGRMYDGGKGIGLDS
jgi:TPR repeat protein